MRTDSSLAGSQSKTFSWQNAGAAAPNPSTSARATCVLKLMEQLSDSRAGYDNRQKVLEGRTSTCTKGHCQRRPALVRYFDRSTPVTSTCLVLRGSVH